MADLISAHTWQFHLFANGPAHLVSLFRRATHSRCNTRSARFILCGNLRNLRIKPSHCATLNGLAHSRRILMFVPFFFCFCVNL